MKIIDLFAGCGGMSLGFEKAGFHTDIAFEKDDWAAQTYKFNHPNTNVNVGVIESFDLNKILPTTIDGIIGGPPCQGFSLSGDRDPMDPRNSLFMYYAKAVEISKPKFFVLENVTGLLSAKNAKKEFVKDVIRSVFTDLGYTVALNTLDASEYGVPQKRKRIFFIGTRNDLNMNPENMYPTTSGKILSVLDAISDLPQLDPKNRGEEESDYDKNATNDYQKLMRLNSIRLHNHVAMRHTPRLIERFKQIKCGQSVASVAEEFSATKRGNPTEKSGKVFSQNNFRVYGDLPCPTVPASFQSNFVHPILDRNFTAREGARLQSFPDTYIFKGKRTLMSWEKNLSQYNQIGNAVPPILAECVARAILEKLNG